jgi:hypothetical protein
MIVTRALKTVIPAKAGIQVLREQPASEIGGNNASGIIPACAGMTV